MIRESAGAVVFVYLLAVHTADPLTIGYGVAKSKVWRKAKFKSMDIFPPTICQQWESVVAVKLWIEKQRWSRPLLPFHMVNFPIHIKQRSTSTFVMQLSNGD